jgi:hypothetical protein
MKLLLNWSPLILDRQSVIIRAKRDQRRKRNLQLVLISTLSGVFASEEAVVRDAGPIEAGPLSRVGLMTGRLMFMNRPPFSCSKSRFSAVAWGCANCS